MFQKTILTVHRQVVRLFALTSIGAVWSEESLRVIDGLGVWVDEVWGRGGELGS